VVVGLGLSFQFFGFAYRDERKMVGVLLTGLLHILGFA
jgi:hypothetical protein